jgi:hypothetical protein
MNITQKQTILNEIETIQSFDFDKSILANYPENTDLKSIVFGKYNALEFKSLLSKTIIQLKAELSNGFGLMLPNQENFYNDFGSVTLDNDIQNLRAYLATPNNENNAAEVLDRLMYYQIRQGFWDRSKMKLHDVDTDKINAANEQLELAQKSLVNNLKTFTSLKTQFEEKQIEIDTFFEAKKQEMIAISTLLSDTQTSNSRITDLVSSSTNKETEIDGILKNIKSKVETVTESIEEYQTDFAAIKKENLILKTDLETTLENALENLKKSKEGNSFIESNRAEIVRLTGMAADGTLGSKFDQRQQKLTDGLSFWKWGVPIITILSIVWVLVVFTCLAANTGNIWINLLINLLKTSPSFILMGFVFSQYNKERNLQEEYAFKSAVAMTLTAYSNMLENKDEDLNKTRQEMLLKSIEQVYNQPKIHSERIEKINTNNLKEAIQTLSDVVKNIKS